MKKFASTLICGALCASLLTACGSAGGSTTNPTTGATNPTAAPTETTASETQTTASYESALALLESVYRGMREEFPAAGGDEAHDTEGPGSFDISTYGESFQYQLLLDDELLGMVKPQAATLLHMMNTNTFCSAAVQLEDAAKADDFAQHYKTIVQSNHWMCGFPDTVVVLSLGDYVLTAYGADDLIQSFKDSAVALGAALLVEAPAEA